MDILRNLNKAQKMAVETIEGPLLILAGAGSGKTKVLVSKAAYLLQEKIVKPGNILAITFTNKAANEMRERMEKMTGISSRNMWIGTFHSICVRILRRESEHCAFDSNFVIYDDHDQQVLIKKCLQELGFDDKKYNARAVSANISKAKNLLLTPYMYLTEASNEWEENIGKIYELYQKRLANNNAVDFDDLIMCTVKLFEQNPQVLQIYQNRFQYILVDEYQDTNTSQYTFINLLAASKKNICAVGDPDQSIYGWRGADIKNILSFEKDYENCRVIKLEQNYRSTKNILSASNSVIANNIQRKEKDLWTEAEDGELIHYHELPDDRSEAAFVVETIELLRRMHGYEYKNFAIIYRTHTQSRVLEDALVKYKLPYKIFGGQRFYERKEIKDTLAYLRLLINPTDEIALARIINEPKRSIGASTWQKLETSARAKDISVYNALDDEATLDTLTPSARKNVLGFYNMMEELKNKVNKISMAELLNELWQVTGYKKALEENDPIAGEARLENLMEFVAAAVDFENTAKLAEVSDEEDALANEATLENFLAQISLATDMDNWEDNQNFVSLLTMHATKGLEFPVVFMTGLEEKIFPHSRSLLDETEMEEERRLCYVAMTRAEKLLYMTRAKSRNIYGNYQSMQESRFIKEIPETYLDAHCIDFAPIRSRYEYKNLDKTNHLFTGRAKPNYQGNTNVQLINIGDKVQHAKFGVGVVVQVQGKGDDIQLNIAFPGQGIKVLMQKYAPLKKV